MANLWYRIIPCVCPSICPPTGAHRSVYKLIKTLSCEHYISPPFLGSLRLWEDSHSLTQGSPLPLVLFIKLRRRSLAPLRVASQSIVASISRVNEGGIHSTNRATQSLASIRFLCLFVGTYLIIKGIWVFNELRWAINTRILTHFRYDI